MLELLEEIGVVVVVHEIEALDPLQEGHLDRFKAFFSLNNVKYLIDELINVINDADVHYLLSSQLRCIFLPFVRFLNLFPRF